MVQANVPYNARKRCTTNAKIVHGEITEAKSEVALKIIEAYMTVTNVTVYQYYTHTW